MDTTRAAYISAGANLGERALTLRGAIRALDAVHDVRVAAVSSIYETDPVGGVVQPPFLNLAARLEIGASVSPELLLAEMQHIEREFGRNRENEIRWGARTLDLDLLVLENETRATGFLTLPHPRMWERAFVLIPLREVAEGALLEKLRKYPANDPAVRLWSAAL